MRSQKLSQALAASGPDRIRQQPTSAGAVQVERLEERRLLTGAAVNARVLTVTGTPNAENIEIYERSDLNKVSVFSDSTEVFNSPFALADFDTILVNAGGGNDTVQLGSTDYGVGTGYGSQFDRPVSAAAEVHGDAGADSIKGTDQADTLEGEAGADEIYGAPGNDTIRGEDDDDDLFGDSADDVVYGGYGNDELDGAAGNDKLYGGFGAGPSSDSITGADSLTGGTGDDSLYGEGGADFLTANAGNDYLYGGDGNDTLRADDGNMETDTLDGGFGTDSGWWEQTFDSTISMEGKF